MIDTLFDLFLSESDDVPRGFTFRDYQLETLDRVKADIAEGARKLLLVKATGLGKTVTMTMLIERLVDFARGGVLIVAHRKELVEQAVEKLHHNDPRLKIGVEMANYRADSDCDVVVASIATLARNCGKDGIPKRLRRFMHRCQMVIVDETHHAKAGGQYEVLLNALGIGPVDIGIPEQYKKDRLLIGVTATPNRSDGRGLGRFYERITVNYDLGYGVDNGWLIKPIIFEERTKVSIADVKTTAGDFNNRQLGDAVNVDSRNATIVHSYFKALEGKMDGQLIAKPLGHAIAFCVNKKHAADLAIAFRAAGVAAVHIDESTDPGNRSAFIAAFKRGEIKVICNCGVLTEGFDASICDLILMARPTKSDSLYVQMVGRGTRPIIDLTPYRIPIERKEAIKQSGKPYLFIIDFVDNAGKNELVTAAKLIGWKDDYVSGDMAPPKEPKELEQLDLQFDEPEQEAPAEENMVLPDREVDIVRNRDAESLTRNESIEKLSDFNWSKLNGSGSVELLIPGRVKKAIRLEKEGDGYRMVHVNLKDGSVKRSKGTVDSLAEAVQETDRWLLTKTNPTQRALMRRDAKWRNKRGKATESQINVLRDKHGVEIPHGMKLKFQDASAMLERLESARVETIVKQNG